MLYNVPLIGTALTLALSFLLIGRFRLLRTVKFGRRDDVGCRLAVYLVLLRRAWFDTFTEWY